MSPTSEAIIPTDYIDDTNIETDYWMNQALKISKLSEDEILKRVWIYHDSNLPCYNCLAYGFTPIVNNNPQNTNGYGNGRCIIHHKNNEILR